MVVIKNNTSNLAEGLYRICTCWHYNIGMIEGNQAMVYGDLYHASDQRVYGDQYHARDPAYPNTVYRYLNHARDQHGQGRPGSLSYQIAKPPL